MCGIDQIYIDGTFVTPRGRERFDLFNPATGRVIGQVRLADAADARGDRRGQGRLPGHGAHEPGRAAGDAVPPTASATWPTSWPTTRFAGAWAWPRW